MGVVVEHCRPEEVGKDVDLKTTCDQIMEARYQLLSFKA